MQAEDARFLKRRIRTTSIDAHPIENAIVVEYHVEATILSEKGEPIIGERKPCKKTIHVESLSETTNLPQLAREIVEQCKLIHVSKLPELEHLLSFLQERQRTQPQRVKKTTAKATGGELDPIDMDNIDELANLNEVDEYMQMLYDEIPAKVKASALILQLARNPDNLEELVQNEALLGALSRILKEECKSSMELATNIVYIFFCLSSFNEFHPVVSHFTVGASCLTILVQEGLRYKAWTEELAKKKKFELSSNVEAKKSYERSLQKYLSLVRKQELLLRVSVYLLLNLSADPATEKKMVNKQVVGVLVGLLNRSNPELLVLVLSFLKNLSVYKENVEEMNKQQLVDLLGPMLASDNYSLNSISLRLLLNLSFHGDSRREIASKDWMLHFVRFLEDTELRKTASSILYHIAIDETNRAAFLNGSHTIKLVRTVLTISAEPEVETAALLLSLSQYEPICRQMSEGKTIPLLLQTALKYNNAVLLKLARIILGNSNLGSINLKCLLQPISSLLNSGKDPVFLAECIALVALNMQSDKELSEAITSPKLVDWIRTQVTKCEGLELRLLHLLDMLGALCSVEASSDHLARNGLADYLIEVLKSNQQNDSIVCRVLYIFYLLLFQPSSRQRVLKNSQVPAYLLDLVHDKNTTIRRLCRAAIDFLEEDNEWKAKLILEKFTWHNAQWLDMAEKRTEESNAADFGQDEDYLNSQRVFFGGLGEEDHLYGSHSYGQSDDDYAFERGASLERSLGSSGAADLMNDFVNSRDNHKDRR